MTTQSCPRSLSRLAALVSVAVFSLAPNGFGQQSLPTKHVRTVVSSGQAAPVGALPTTQQIQLEIMLPLRNQEALTSFLGRLQDRTSSDYRKFLSVQQFTDQFSPAASDYQAAVAWAQSKGFQVGEQPANRLVIPIVGTVSQINQAFNVQLASYQHPTENRTFFAPDREPTVDLTVPLWHIAGLDNYSVPHPLYVMGSVAHGNTGSGPGGAFLGSDRRAAYYGSTTLTGAGQSVGIFELDGYSISDVQAYFTNVGQPLSAPINNVLIDGASGASDGIDDSEQVIDIIEAASMAPGLSQILVYIGPRSTFNPGTTDVDIFNRMASDNIAKQISVSWAWEPADPSYLDPIFQQFMAQGQTVFAASGDNSAWVSGDYYEGLPEIYPAEDPNVTAVGGTVLTTSGAGGPRASEIAWGDANNTCQANYLDPYPGSGGGTSLDNIPIPQYQQLGGVINSSNLGSTTLRNAPDVAAEANCDNYYCANGGCGQGIGGTSLAAPTWAGFTALVNQQVVANGNTPLGGLGSINPLLYSIGVGPDYNRDLYDITIGDNITPASNNLSPAVPGYDLVTGWGSPNGQSLIQDLQPLPIAGTLTNAATKQIVKFNDCTNTIFDYTWTFTDQAGAHGFTGTSSFITRSGGRDCAPGSEYVPLDEWSADGLYYLEATGGTGSIVLHE